jgi:epoxide hydrolase-like protein
MSSPSSPSPFTINVPDAVLRDLADRLARTRFPERTAAPRAGRHRPGLPARTHHAMARLGLA